MSNDDRSAAAQSLGIPLGLLATLAVLTGYRPGRVRASLWTAGTVLAIADGVVVCTRT